MIWIVLLAVIALLLAYLLIARPLLKSQPALSPIFKAEASLWDQLQAKITGWRTKIAARLLGIGGVLVMLYDQLLPYVAGQDWAPITSRLPGWALPVGIMFVSWLFDKLRKMTENPPQIILQTDVTGASKVVDLIQPAG